ncbi:DUF6635 family protein [Acidisoma sp. C75]
MRQRRRAETAAFVAYMERVAAATLFHWAELSLEEHAAIGELILTLDAAQAEAAVADGARRYFAAAHARVTPFVDAHFSLSGTLALHQAAVGLDILRAPANLTLAAPQLALQLGSRIAGRLGAPRVARALNRSILIETALSREIEWLIHTELLDLPIRQKARESRRDGLARAILESPTVAMTLESMLLAIGRQGGDPAFRERLRAAMAEYGLSRNAAAEITTGLINLAAGALALQKVTPGAATLGPALASALSQQMAIGSFPFGSWLGTAWYALFPTAPAAGLVMTTTGGVMLASAALAAFAGVIADPIQRATGLHARRLHAMIDKLEDGFFDPLAPGFAVHAHYVARLLDLFDLLAATARLVR